MNLTDEEFRLISKLLYDRFGIHLSDQKRTLVIERLQRTVQQGGYANFKAYYQYVVTERSGEALLHMVDRLSTNHTFFFRENEHFDFLKDTILPTVVERQQRRGNPQIRIWSAGCSSGEEAYTIAMVLKEYLGVDFAKWDVGILATDISTTVLEKAVSGIYAENQLEGLPDGYRKRYFQAIGAGQFSISPELRKLVLFRRLNLMNETYPFKGLFQVVFCRNVMIYFDESTRQELVSRFARYTEDRGHLLIGHSETLSKSHPAYEYVKPAVYRKQAR